MTLGLDSQDLLTDLTQVSQQLIEEVNDLRPAQATLSPALHEWSAKEVMCHLRDADRIYIERMQKMLQEDEPLLRAFYPEALATENNYQNQDWTLAFREFLAARQQLITIFNELRPGQWYKAGMHQELGRINMFDIAQTITEHSRMHLAQLRNLKEMKS